MLPGEIEGMRERKRERGRNHSFDHRERETGSDLDGVQWDTTQGDSLGPTAGSMEDLDAGGLGPGEGDR